MTGLCQNSFSSLMLGTVQFGMRYGVANKTGKPDEDEVAAILKYALDHGINALDTAPEYGDSEEIIGRSLKKLGITEQFQIVTKIPHLPAEENPADFIKESLVGSLQRLGCGRIAVALFHAEQDAAHMEELKSMIGQGLIGGAGISLNTLAFASCGEKMEYLQVPANLVDRRFRSLFGGKARHVFIRGAYLQGMLLMKEEEIFIRELIPLRRRLLEYGIPMKELCLRYLLTLPGNNSVLTGVETLQQFQENVAIVQKGKLDEELFQRIENEIDGLEEIAASPYFWRRYKEIAAQRENIQAEGRKSDCGPVEKA